MSQKRTESVFSNKPADQGSPALEDGAVGKRRVTQAERTALSDERMFTAAMKLISRQGAARTTLREICLAAGYSRGLANYRFGSKDAFLQQLLVHFNRAWEEHLEAHVGHLQGFAAVQAASHALESFLRNNADYMRGGYTIWYESIAGNNAISEKLKSNHHTYRRDIARWLQQGVSAGEIAPIDVDQFANYYCTLVFGTIYMWLADADSVDLSKQFNFVRAQMLMSLRPVDADLHNPEGGVDLE